MKTFLQWLVAIPVGIVLLIFAIVNRHTVTVSFDPFETAGSEFQLTAPLFIALFAALALGLIVGGCTTWFLQSRYRRAASRARGEAARLQAEIDRLRAQERDRSPPAGRMLARRDAA